MRLLMLICAVPACGRINFARHDAADLDAPADAPFDPAVCPPSYTISVPSTRSRYRHAIGPLEFLAANAACVADQTSPQGFTHLAVFRDYQEQVELMQLFDDAWVGYSDRLTEGEFLAVTLEPIGDYLSLGSQVWFPNEPNEQGGEDCLHIKEATGLNDIGCGTLRRLLCECDGYPDTPSQY